MHTKPKTILPTSPKNIFAGFQFQYKKAKQVDVIKISNEGKYSELFGGMTFRNIRGDGGKLLGGIYTPRDLRH